MPPRSSGWTSTPALALREKKDASILVAMDLVRQGEADAVVTAGHTGAGHGRGRPAARPPAGRRPAGARGPAGRGGRDRSSSSTSARTPTRPPENLAQYARMGAIFSERVLGIASPRVALLSIGEEKGKGDARIQQATELLDATGPQLRRQRRGQGPHAAPGRRRRDRRSRRQRRHQVLRGALDLHLRPVPRTSSDGSLRGKVAGLLMRPGIDRIRQVFDYERVGGSPLLGVKGTVIITHGRAKRRMIGFGGRCRGDDGPDPRPGADRRGPKPARQAPPAASSPAEAGDPPSASRGTGTRPRLTLPQRRWNRHESARS